MHEHITSFQHTNSDDVHGSTAASIAVDGHNTDNVHYIVRQNDWNTCCTGGEEPDAWTESYGVADWSATIILWRLPPHHNDHTVPTILVDHKRGSPWRKRETCMETISKNSHWLSTADSSLWLYRSYLNYRS